MKMTKKLVVVAAALAFATAGAFAQQRNTTTTTTTTTTYVEEYEESTDAAYAEEMEEVETGTYTETRTYEAYVAVPVETTKESTYVVKQGKPQTVWSAADFIDPYAFHISNVISSDILKLRDAIFPENADLYAAEMGDIVEQVVVDYDAKRLKFKLAPKVAVGQTADENFWTTAAAKAIGTAPISGSKDHPLHPLNRDDVALFFAGIDWFVEIWPFDFVSIDINNSLFTPGANMAVTGSVATGNLTDGVALVLRPNDNLRISAMAPIAMDGAANWLNAEKNDSVDLSKLRLDFGLGVDYKFGNAFTLGFVAKNLLAGLEGLQMGVYASITPNNNMFINFGVTLDNGPQGFDYWSYSDDWEYNENAKIGGGLLINGAFGYDNGKFDTGIDVLAAFIDIANNSLSKQYADLYIGAKIGYWFIPDTLKASAKLFGAFDFDGIYKCSNYSAAPATPNAANAADTVFFGFQPTITYKLGRNTFDAGVVVEWAVGTNNLHYVKFPVSWTYRFI